MKSQLEAKNIKFEGGELLGVRDKDGKVYLAVKKACMDIGLTEKQASRQVENIQKDIVLLKCVKKMNLKFGVQVRETVVIGEDAVSLWLAKISLTPAMQKKNPEAVSKLVSYQLKAQKALHEAFMAIEDDRQALFNELGLKGDIVELKTEFVELKSTLNTLIDNSTINSRQAQRLLHAAKDRVNSMLGGAHSPKYKKYSRTYFKNLWLDFGRKFECSTYKDLNPMYMSDAYTFVTRWSMN